MDISSLNIKDDLLNIIILGPGFGESILIKSPGSQWIAVDCFYSVNGKNVPPLSVVRKVTNSRCNYLFLSHPHEDHCAGVEDFLDVFPDTKVVINDYFEKPNIAEAVTLGEIHSRGRKNSALARISLHSRVNSGGVLKMHQGERVQDHDLDIEILYPQKGERPKGGPNDVASPLLVTWKGRSILLGSDLERPGWKKVNEAYPPKGSFLFKIPHHGSKTSQDKENLKQEHNFQIITPFVLGKESLPSFESDDGLHFILGFERSVHLTSLPFRTRKTEVKQVKLSREEVKALQIRKPVGGDVFAVELMKPADMKTGWIHIAVDENDSVSEFNCSSGTFEITAEESQQKNKDIRKKVKSRKRS